MNPEPDPAPDAPADVALKVRTVALWRDMGAAHAKLGTMIARRREEPVRYYLDRLARLFLGMPPPKKRERERQPLADFDSEELVLELRRRVRMERDRYAASVLSMRLPERRQRKESP